MASKVQITHVSSAAREGKHVRVQSAYRHASAGVVSSADGLVDVLAAHQDLALAVHSALRKLCCLPTNSTCGFQLVDGEHMLL